MKLVTAEEMRRIERTVADQGLTVEMLIRLAGQAVAEAVQRLAPRGTVLVLAGPGNNGADGLTAASLLAEQGRHVHVFTFRRRDAAPYSGQSEALDDADGLSVLRRHLSVASIVVDALLGTGQTRAPENVLADALKEVNGGPPRLVRLSVDIPTGVDADTGAVLGAAFRATSTVSMGFAKRGIALYPGAEFCGDVWVAPVGIPRGCARNIAVEQTERATIQRLLPVRRGEGNKGSSGRLLFIGGSDDFSGAPAVAAMSAYRAGAGLVEIGTPGSVRPIVATFSLEPVFRSLPEQDGKIAPSAAPVVKQALERASACALGPGMGLGPGTIEFMRSMLTVLAANDAKPSLIDADGLNALAQIKEWWKTEFPRVLTPHPGEMSRLTGLSIAEVQADRIEVARRHASKWRSVVVLKGAGTVVADPDGRAAVNPTGGPNLSTAGTGDVLSGIIGGLLAQGCRPWDAAIAGAYWHGAAGDILRRRWGDVGTVAGDLPAVLREARLEILQSETATP